jgi:opacity protein-like surface antigen
MKKLLAAAMSVVFVASLTAVAAAETACPEVDKAKQMLTQKTGTAKGQEIQAPRSLAGARQDVQAGRGQDVQAPRSLAGARGQDVQAPRGQDVQAPRGQDVQAPRGQDVQAPRGQDVQAPRSMAGAKTSSGNITKASTLIKEAEAACKSGDKQTAKTKADAAINILK